MESGEGADGFLCFFAGDENRQSGGVLDLVPLKTLMARRPDAGLAVAESLTCGGVQARIGAVSGASTFFRGGVTAYTLDQKVRLLGVDRAEAEACKCVSESVARQMARGVIQLFASRIGLATTGYAEPAPTEGVAVPFAWWAVVELRDDGEWIERSGRVDCPDLDRTAVQAHVSETVLAALLAHLREEAA